MKFRFCGNIEPPDWIQSSVPIFAQKSPEDLTSLTKCALNEFTGEHAVPSLSTENDDDTDTMIAWISFVLEHAAKYDITGAELQAELLQLGMKQEHTTALSKAFTNASESIREFLATKRFQFAKLDRLELKIENDSGICGSISSKLDVAVHMSLDVTEKCDKFARKERIECKVDSDKFSVLYQHLLQAQETLSELSERGEAE
uniref:Uncharacterized protein AlNc14C4G538 n=1 Tax=Albugo laibachii Nc14 TaxID=890382 RepID=F0W096_9STRA|nr:PREDICTED: hypothetical protein [Albugo laibachii Nc14]|eukprot:CCA14467.1 PREDICTED: hypothetical protein [Albugo laibachii Nc14]